MRFLHTADWHLGSTLHEERRTKQFQAMLDELISVIEKEHIDAVLLSGDVFDNANPSSEAQKQYYTFLASCHNAGCKDVVVIAGNHDSPALLEAPKELLSCFDVHVVAHPGEQEIIGLSEAVVIAVPFLRESDISTWIEGDDLEAQIKSYQENVKNHYHELSEQAKQQYPGLPQIFMGHCYLSGSKVYDGESEREYVGTLGALPVDTFPTDAAYVALGHIHIPEQVGKTETIRYSGSPIAVNFSEAGQQKSCVIIDVENGKTMVSVHDLPSFCMLKTVKGNIEDIEKALLSLKDEPWMIEVRYTGSERIPDLNDRLHALVKEGKAKLLRVFDEGLYTVLTQDDASVDLQTLTPMQVFQMRLDQEKDMDTDKDKDKRARLTALFAEVLKEPLDENL